MSDLSPDNPFMSKGKGFTLVEIMIVVLIIGVLLAIAIPQFTKARTEARLNWVLQNLTLIEKSYEQCMMEQGDTPDDCTTCSSDFVANTYMNGYKGLNGVTNDDEFEFGCGLYYYRGKTKQQWKLDPTGL
jgi:prepilin-type N-terminal cleavage/methylation domain-containing protein